MPCGILVLKQFVAQLSTELLTLSPYLERFCLPWLSQLHNNQLLQLLYTLVLILQRFDVEFPGKRNGLDMCLIASKRFDDVGTGIPSMKETFYGNMTDRWLIKIPVLLIN